MEDIQIIELYNKRDETAISETSSKYGRLLNRIAFNILATHEDCEEVVNDTYSKAWNNIPPDVPNIFSAYLSKITRNLSINLWHKRTAIKRGGNESLLSELEECIPSSDNVEQSIERSHLLRAIEEWLDGLSADDRILFIRRYWFCDPINMLSSECSCSSSALVGRLYRMRQSLKKSLELEGIVI